MQVRNAVRYYRISMKKSSLRIAFIGAKGIPASASSRAGGVERHVTGLAKRLAAHGHHVTVYVRPYMNRKRRKRWNGVHLVTLPTVERKNFDAIVHTFFSVMHVLFRDVDVIHFQSVGPSTLAWIPRLLKRKTRIVATFHARDRYHEKWSWFGRLYLALGEWAICRFPHKTIAVSHELQLFCQKMYNRDAVHIPNAVTIPSKRVGKAHIRALGLEPNNYIIMLGRLIPVKAFDDAIRAFKEIDTDKKLLVIGDVSFDSLEYKVKLERLAMDDERVVLMGFRRGKELQQLIAHTYCMIHPARSEGLSVAILEAMSHGKVVVMSDIPGNRELVDHSGVAYPVGNVRALKDAVEWVLSDPVMVATRGERARKVVKELYSWERSVERTEELYQKAVAREL